MHSTNPRLLAAACSAWQAAAAFRERRSRFKNFTYGDQWGDLTLDADRRLRREDDVLLDSGRRPVTNNLIRQMVKTVVGRYRARRADAAQGHTDSGPMAEIAARNDLDELDARMLEEFLISGCAVQRVVDERRFCGCGVWVDNVDPRRLFFRRFSDPRGLDIELIGMLHDMSMPEVISRFAAGSSHRADRLRHIFALPTVPIFSPPRLPIAAGWWRCGLSIVGTTVQQRPSSSGNVIFWHRTEPYSTVLHRHILTAAIHLCFVCIRSPTERSIHLSKMS